MSAKPRLRLLLDHFWKIKDTRQAWKVAYPLREVLFLVVCGTIASGDDYEDIVDWGKAHLSFLRGFAEFHYGIPCADWLRTVMNRINPDLFRACFTSWVEECWPDKLDLVAIDGKTSRRTHNRKTGQKALHLVSAFATKSRLVLGQEAVDERNRTRSPPFRPWWSASILRCPGLDRRHGMQSQHRPVDPRRRGRLPSGRQGQPADAACRYRKLFRNRAVRRGREGRNRG